MPSFHLDINHSLDPAEVRRRADDLLNQTGDKFSGHVSDVNQAWDGMSNNFSFRAAGATVKGTIEIQPSLLVIRGEIPWTFAFFKGKIESVLRENAEKMLAPDSGTNAAPQPPSTGGAPSETA